MTAGTDKEEAEQLALAAPKVQSYLEGRQVRKVIVVPERLVNIVCGQQSESRIKSGTTKKILF